MPRILLVEDDNAVRDVVEHALSREGMDVLAVTDGDAVPERFQDSGPFDLVILDIMLPGKDGVTLCQEIRASSDVPVVILTARDDETSVVVGLEVGADDYITKPFSPRELASRVRAHLRRRRLDARSSERQLLEFPGLSIDLLRREVTAGERPVSLTAREFEVLAFMAAHPGRVYSREQIMRHIWNGEFYGEARAADVHIQHIRKKVEPDPGNPRYIQTVRGMGYRFADLGSPNT